MRRAGRKLLLGLVVAGAACAAVMAVYASERIPDAPEPIVWDREACAHCHMHVGDPAFAAQAIDSDGRVYNFDDPGCLLAWRGTRQLARIWFHHKNEDRWLPLDAAGFVTVNGSPMGSNLGAVDATVPGALTAAAATETLRRAP